MRFIFLISIVVAVFLSLPSLTALSLAGKQLGTITYIPGTAITNHYWVTDTAGPVTVMVDGAPFSNITVTEVINNEFDLIIYFPPNEYIPPETYALGLTVVEGSGTGGDISARVAVSKKITIQVFSYEKDIVLGLNVPNINEGNNVTLSLTANSVGYPDIDAVYGVLTVYDAEDKLMGEKITSSKPLLGLESVAFLEKFDSSKWPAANYKARAVVNYDGNQKEINTTFLIGNMDLVVKDYTKQLEEEFDEFSVTVVNNWGNPLRNVYAKLILNGQEALQTPSLTLAPWQEDVLKGILEVNLKPGEYPATLQLFFEGERKDVPFTITVVPKPKEVVPEEVRKAKSLVIVPLLITGLVIIFILTIYFLRRRKSSATKDEF